VVYVRLRAGGEWSARIEEVNGEQVTVYECVDSATGEVCWLPGNRFGEGQASTGPVAESVLDSVEVQVKKVFGAGVQRKVKEKEVVSGPPESWGVWDPVPVEVPWWCTSGASVAAFVACYCAGAPLSLLSFSSGPIFGPVPVEAIISGVVVTVGWVGAFAGFFAFQRKSTPWVPVREEVKQEVAVGSVEEVRQVLSDTVKKVREGKLKTSAANTILKISAVQAQLGEGGGLAGVLGGQEGVVQGPAVKRWVNGRGFVRVQKAGRKAWHSAEEYGWQAK